MFIYFVCLLIVAVISNDASRSFVLSTLFGESSLYVLETADIRPADVDGASYSDGVYEVHKAGYRTIQWLSGAQVRNLLAYNVCVSYVITAGRTNEAFAY